MGTGILYNYTPNALGNSGSSKTVDWRVSTFQTITLTAACTLTFTAPPSGSRLTLLITQDSTGRVITWPASVVGTPPIYLRNPSAVTQIEFEYDGTNYRCVSSTAQCAPFTDANTSRNLVAGDAGAYIYVSDAAGCTFTIPDAVFTAGDVVMFEQGGAGVVTISAGSGVTLNKPATKAATSSEQNSVIGIVFRTASIATLFGAMADA